MITETSVLNIASMTGIRDKLSDFEIILFTGALNHAIREDLKMKLCEMLGEQHAWLTNIAAANLVRNFKEQS